MRLYRRDEGGSWWVDFWHGGRRIRRSASTTDRAAAQEWADRLKSDLWRSDRLGERPAVLWDTACLDWLEAHHLRPGMITSRSGRNRALGTIRCLLQH
jgi:hypothetical protein